MFFIIPGKPVPKARARIMRGGWAFTPKKTRQAEMAAKTAAVMALKQTERPILGPKFTGRLFVTIVFFGARRNADLDNLYKTVTDACQGTLYVNDSQIDHAEIVRQECPKGTERIEVCIEVMK